MFETTQANELCLYSAHVGFVCTMFLFLFYFIYFFSVFIPKIIDCHHVTIFPEQKRYIKILFTPSRQTFRAQSFVSFFRTDIWHSFSHSDQEHIHNNKTTVKPAQLLGL